ncbi:MAG: amidohydrolase [Armatimonadetes bacterium]|nr:amidohydrolase [Armatimonadota bacterium]
METALTWIDQHSEALIRLADTIWEYAEVGLREHKSSAAQIKFLEEEGFTVTTGVGGMPTAFVASYGQGKPIIGFLGEFDALPGLSQKRVPVRDPVKEGAPGHGCGHNLLGTAALGAAVAIRKEMEATGLVGTVRYYGCPAEETLVGKVFMAREGVFNDLDAALTWHPMHLNSVWMSQSLAMNSVRFVFHGQAAHAAAQPHMGISALDAVELMNIGVNFLREHVIPDARIHYVITRGGGEPNVVPPVAEVWYYVRAPRRTQVDEIYARVLKIAEGAALMTGARLEVNFQVGCYDFLANPVVSQLMVDSLKRVGPPKFTEEEKAFARQIEESFAPGQKETVMRGMSAPKETWDLTLHQDVADIFDAGKILPGSTDVGDVSWITATGQITTATYVIGTASHSWQVAAAAGTGIGQRSMLVAARGLAATACELFTKPEVLAQAREAFLKDTAGKPYVSPLPPDLKPPLEQLAEH